MTKQRNDATTFHQFAQAEADTVVGGRFGAVEQSRVIVGSTLRPAYPAAAAHQDDPVGPEPPISFMDAVEPVGEHYEIKESLSALSEAVDDSGGSPSPEAVESTSPGGELQSSGTVSSSVIETGSPPSSRKRKKRG